MAHIVNRQTSSSNQTTPQRSKSSKCSKRKKRKKKRNKTRNKKKLTAQGSSLGSSKKPPCHHVKNASQHSTQTCNNPPHPIRRSDPVYSNVDTWPPRTTSSHPIPKSLQKTNRTPSTILTPSTKKPSHHPPYHGNASSAAPPHPPSNTHRASRIAHPKRPPMAAAPASTARSRGACPLGCAQRSTSTVIWRDPRIQRRGWMRWIQESICTCTA